MLEALVCFSFKETFEALIFILHVTLRNTIEILN